jgi:hypothetical protein
MLADDADAVGEARQHNAGASSRRQRHAEVPGGHPGVAGDPHGRSAGNARSGGDGAR